MTTKITLDPALVRAVLDKYIDTSKNIMLYASYGEELWEENKDAIVQHSLNIHEFKDMAIKKCAEWGYPIRAEYYYRVPRKYQLDGEVWVIGKGINTPFCWGKESDYPDKLSAELAAISFVWEQIQKEEKTC